MLREIIDYFVSTGSKELSISDVYRARILVSSSITTAVCILPFLLFWGVSSNFSSILFQSLAVLFLCLLTAPFVFRHTQSITTAGLYVNLGSTLVLLVVSFYAGGYYSAALIFFPIVPLFSVFYCGLRYGFLVTAILLSDLVFLFYAHKIGIVPAVAVGSTQHLLFYLGATSAMLLILLDLARNYMAWQKVVHDGLVAANLAKNEFLSGVSHELRTPLNSILGFSEVLSQGYAGPLNDKQIQYTNFINSSGMHLLSLVNDLLDLSKIEAGKMEFTLAPVNIDDLFASTLSMLRTEGMGKEISIQHSVTEQLRGKFVALDEIKIKQVLINLLSNALKFTPKQGQVMLSADICDNQLVISVTDDGPGIPAEYHDSVFERFFQLHTETANKDPGTGLGLTICRHFVELHDGKIYLQNEEKGAHFICELPLTFAEATTQAA